ncbi:MAG: siderophore-iron reductase FhuF [Marinobacter sp.]|uniref:siderophore-iron reductase FhuF n=1 Tax=Marinobacter sp. TaxID=50741 RepID=UPI0034A0A6C8
MLTGLKSLLSGDFEQFQQALVLADDPRPSIPMRDCLAPEQLDNLLNLYAGDNRDVDRRALASLWSRTYFLRLAVPSITANLVLDWELPVELDDIEVILTPDGQAEAFRISSEGRALPSSGETVFERFQTLVDDNFSPFIQALSRQIKVSPRVLWNNAGNYVEWLVGALEHHLGPDQVSADGHQLINLQLRPDGSRNPLYQPVRYVERSSGPSPLRQRRQCCLRYRLPELGLCENCPHIDCPPKAAR